MKKSAGTRFSTSAILTFLLFSPCHSFRNLHFSVLHESWLVFCRRVAALKRFRLNRCLTLQSLNFTVINPYLHADDSVNGVGFSRTVIDIRSQGMKRNAVLAIPFCARDFGT